MRYLFVLIVALFILTAADISNAQVGDNLKLNLESQPDWGRAGYNYVEFYYLPDINIYYYIPAHGYYYFSDRQWYYSRTLPSLFAGFDLYNSYKVVMNEQAPWRDNKSHIEIYASYKGRHDQLLIRDSQDSNYFVKISHPEFDSWLRQQNDNNFNVKSDKQNNNPDN
jgi:hypothetical protein